MKKIITIFFGAAFIFLINFKLSAFVFPWEDKDKLLLEALENNNLNNFESLLKGGANPNAILGRKSHEWVMCLVNKVDNISFLKLAMQYGGDINLRNQVEPIKTNTSAPILCAITFSNDRSFNALLRHNVDLSIHTFENAQPIPEDSTIAPKFIGKTLYGSPLVFASLRNEFCMAHKILQHKEPNWEELDSLIRSVEISNIDSYSKDNKCRLEIIEGLRQKGHDIDPERAKKERLELRRKRKARYQ